MKRGSSRLSQEPLEESPETIKYRVALAVSRAGGGGPCGACGTDDLAGAWGVAGGLRRGKEDYWRPEQQNGCETVAR